MTSEVWRPVADAPGYEVSDQGRVRRGEHILTPWLVASSRDPLRCYLKLGLCGPGGRRRVFVHRLVAAAFCDRPDDATDVCHLNHTSTDNRACNLAWKAHGANIADTYGEDAVERRAIFEESLGLLSYLPPDGEPF